MNPVVMAIWLGGASVFGIPLWIILSFIALVFIIGYWVPQISKPIPKGLYTLLTLVFIFAAILTSPFASIPQETTTPQTTIVAEPTEYTIDVDGGTDTSSIVSYDETTHKFTIVCGYNETSDSIVTSDGGAWSNPVLNFTVVALPTEVASTDKVVPVSAQATVPSFSVSGETYYLVSKDSNGKYNLLWETEDGMSDKEDIQFTVPFSSPKWVTLTITLDSDAIAQLSEYQSKDITVTIGGQTFTVSVMKVETFS